MAKKKTKKSRSKVQRACGFWGVGEFDFYSALEPVAIRLEEAEREVFNVIADIPHYPEIME